MRGLRVVADREKLAGAKPQAQGRSQAQGAKTYVPKGPLGCLSGHKRQAI